MQGWEMVEPFAGGAGARGQPEMPPMLGDAIAEIGERGHTVVACTARANSSRQVKLLYPRLAYTGVGTCGNASAVWKQLDGLIGVVRVFSLARTTCRSQCGRVSAARHHFQAGPHGREHRAGTVVHLPA